MFFCPYTGCTSLLLKKMTQNLQQFHKLPDAVANCAKKVCHPSGCGKLVRVKKSAYCFIGMSTYYINVLWPYSWPQHWPYKEISGQQKGERTSGEWWWRMLAIMRKKKGGSSHATTCGMQVHVYEFYHFMTYFTSRAEGIENAKGVTNVVEFHFYANSHEADSHMSLKVKKV